MHDRLGLASKAILTELGNYAQVSFWMFVDCEISLNNPLTASLNTVQILAMEKNHVCLLNPGPFAETCAKRPDLS